MADIEVVIKIPEEICERFGYEYREESAISKYTNDIILDAFCNGIPLPKGHGRLKDIDAFISKVQTDRQHAVYTRSWTADDVLNALTNSYAPTIIEADKESEEISDTNKKMWEEIFKAESEVRNETDN